MKEVETRELLATELSEKQLDLIKNIRSISVTVKKSVNNMNDILEELHNGVNQQKEAVEYLQISVALIKMGLIVLYLQQTILMVKLV